MDEFQILLDDHWDPPVPTIIRNFLQSGVADFARSYVRVTINAGSARCIRVIKMDELEKRWICLIHLLDIFERILTGRENVACIYTDTEFRRVKRLDEGDEII